MPEQERDAIALEGVAAFVEGLVPDFPARDQVLWWEAVCRMRRMAAELRSAQAPPAVDLRHRWRRHL